MEIREALTFDDVLLVPGASSVLPSEADTRTLFVDDGTTEVVGSKATGLSPDSSAGCTTRPVTR